MSQLLDPVVASKTVFFPDTNVIIGLVLDEPRFGGSNRLFLRQVRKFSLECVILPTIQNEFYLVLKKTLDDAERIMNLFLGHVAKWKTDYGEPMRESLLGVEDTPLLEKAFDSVYREISNNAPDKKDRLVARYDWVESMGFTRVDGDN